MLGFTIERICYHSLMMAPTMQLAEILEHDGFEIEVYHRRICQLDVVNKMGSI